MLPQVVNGYEWEGNEIKVIRLNGQPLFHGRSIALALGITESRARDMTKEMDNIKDYVIVTNAMISNCSDVGSTDIRKLNNRGETFFTESGLYEIMLQSRKPDAKKFRQWITREVLPSLRERGYYGNAPSLPQLPGNYLSALRALVASEEEKLELQEAIAQKDQQLMIAAPKVEAFEAIGRASGSILIGRAAVLIGSHKIGLGPHNIFKYLRKNGILKLNDEPYAPYSDYFDVVEGTHYEPQKDGSIKMVKHSTTRIYYKGVAWLLKRLTKEYGKWYNDDLEDLKTNFASIVLEGE